MIKAIVFDFDGVIADSAHIKTQAFRDIFIDFGEENADKIMKYHMENMGISRYKKFQYFYEDILERSYDEGIGAELSQKFSDIVVKKIIDSPFIKGAKNFLEQNKGTYKLFIATGTPQDEIQMIVQKKGIISYFDGVFGSPRTKGEIVKDIISRYEFDPSEMVFVGDAMSDYKAAKETRLYFVGRIENTENNIFPDETAIISNLEELEEKLIHLDYKNKI